METKRCDNLACVCDVPLTQEVCGDFCASPAARDANAIKCECGHPICKREMEVDLSGQPPIRE